MERRDFIKRSVGASIALPFWLQSCTFIGRDKFPIAVHSDHETGHMVMDSTTWPTKDAGKTEIAIVGGGLAGVSAAISLEGRDFKLFELSNRLGGSSSAQDFDSLLLSQGAHYDLAYPDYYGEEVLKLFESLDLIEYQPWKKNWTFTDKQHLIPFTRRQQCYENGKIRKEVISDSLEKNRFYELLDSYYGKMPLPTRLITDEYRSLNDITFHDFLKREIGLSPQFKRQVDYHMLDDWGGTSDQVSALAGIHYFTCRPYVNIPVDLFSPPEGNYYFLRKMLPRIPHDQIFTDHLVKKVEKVGEEFLVEVLDVEVKQIKRIKAENVIYAGQKQGLKYIYPQESHLFDSLQAPWMVLNFVCDSRANNYGFWQNEYLGENTAFIGFIDSSVQSKEATRGKRIFTAYYCLKPKDRAYLKTIPENRKHIANETLAMIEEVLNEKLKVEACFVNVMGHAMSIPTPGFLFNDANDKGADLIYAGVDNGRLPLLYEAVDSGILAANKIVEHSI